MSSAVQSQVSLDPSPQGRRNWKVSHKSQSNMLLICTNAFGDFEVHQSYTVGLRRASQKRWYSSRILNDGGRAFWGVRKQHVQIHRDIQQYSRLRTPGWLAILKKKKSLSSCAISLRRWDFYKRSLVSALGDNCHSLARKWPPEK